MKKITIVSAVSLLFLLTCSLVAKLTEQCFTDVKTPLIIGVSVLAASGILALIVRDTTAVNVLCAIISAIAMGFVIRAWYVLRGLENSLGLMALISLGAVVYLWLYFALIRLPVVRESAGVTVAVTALYVVISVIIYLLLVFGTQTSFVSTIGFYTFIELSFIFAMSLEVNDQKELIRNLTISTYSVFIVAIIVALFALAASGGDCDCDCGGCDCDGCGGSSANTKKPKRKIRR
jgi:hypothetical protein